MSILIALQQSTKHITNMMRSSRLSQGGSGVYTVIRQSMHILHSGIVLREG